MSIYPLHSWTSNAFVLCKPPRASLDYRSLSLLRSISSRGSSARGCLVQPLLGFLPPHHPSGILCDDGFRCVLIGCPHPAMVSFYLACLRPTTNVSTMGGACRKPQVMFRSAATNVGTWLQSELSLSSTYENGSRSGPPCTTQIPRLGASHCCSSEDEPRYHSARCRNPIVSNTELLFLTTAVLSDLILLFQLSRKQIRPEIRNIQLDWRVQLCWVTILRCSITAVAKPY